MDPRSIPSSTPVVIGLDGSFSQDCTALVVVSVEEVPHVDVVELWEPPVGAMDYRLPVADVEEAIRQACPSVGGPGGGRGPVQVDQDPAG